MSKDTLFTNDAGAAAGTQSYIQDNFQDVSLPASNNSGLTSNALTNPLSGSFANDDAPKYSSKTLWIKDFLLIQDRSKWVSNKPTYSIIWHESCPSVQGYLFGNLQYNTETGQTNVQFKTIGDGIGIGGVIRKVAYLVQGNTAATATAQLVLDGVNTTTIDFSSLAANSDSTPSNRYNAYPHAASNESKDLHDFRLTALQANTLQVLGVVVYYENTSFNVDLFPGTTYVDKSKITTTLGSTLPLAVYGSSLGGKSVIYKTQTSGYAQSSVSCSTVISIAQATAGTNLINVSTGHGSSFPVGCGVVVPAGTTCYIGSVRSISTDTLTMSPSLSFGLSNSIYRAWLSGPTYGINASLMSLGFSLDYSQYFGLTTPILDPLGRFNVFGSNMGITTIDSKTCGYFLGASGYLQVDGYFSAAEFETMGSAILGATVSVNGCQSWSMSESLAGPLRKTLVTELGPGYNSVVIAPSASMGVIGFAKFNFYQRSRDIGIAAGILAEYETIQSFSDRGAANATIMALGTYQRFYADNLYLKGSWIRGLTTGAAGGVLYAGSSTNSTLRHYYYGKNFAMIGVAAAGATLALDGSGISNTFNIHNTVATEGFHTITYAVTSGTGIIQAIDIQRTIGEVRSLQNYNPAKPLPTFTAFDPPSARYSTVTAQSIAGSNTDVVNFDTKDRWDNYGAVTTGTSWNFKAPVSGRYRVSASLLSSSQSVTSGGGWTLNTYINGSYYSMIARFSPVATTATRIFLGGGDIVPLSINDQLDIRARFADTATLDTTAGENHVLIEYIGPLLN